MKFLTILIIALTTSLSLLADHGIRVASMAVGKKYQKITYPTFVNKTNYCNKHGYPFDFFTESFDESRPIYWSKILITLKLMEETEADWIFWTDADSFIMNDNISLEKFIDPDYDMLIGSDFTGINTGQFLIKNCEWSKDFLKRIYVITGDRWWEEIDAQGLGWLEQTAMILQLKRSETDNEHVKILPQRMINSYAPEIWSKDDFNNEICWNRDDFLIHFAGIKNQKLIKLINKYSKKSQRSSNTL